MKQAVLITLLVFTFESNFCQKASEDFIQINKAYKEIPKISMDIVYTLFPNYSTDAFIDRKNGVYKKEDKSYYNNLMGAQTIVNNSKMITIHDEQKSITLSPAKPLYGTDLAGMNLDKLLKMYEKIEFVNKSETEKGYILYFRKGQGVLEKFEMYYNKENYLLTKIVLYYDKFMEFSQDGTGKSDKPKLVIEFNNINTKPKFNPDDFNIEKYVVFGNKNKLSQPFQNYRFIESKI